jgi:CheY-like chemotaxis protein
MYTNKPILIVDDDPKDLELTLGALSNVGLPREVLVARDGADALDLIYARNEYQTLPTVRPSVVLLDLKMHRMDGFAFLEAIKSDPSHRDIPIVVFSASREQCDLQRCYAQRANAYVVKPATFTAFTSALAATARFWADRNVLPPASAH